MRRSSWVLAGVLAVGCGPDAGTPAGSGGGTGGTSTDATSSGTGPVSTSSGGSTGSGSSGAAGPDCVPDEGAQASVQVEVTCPGVCPYVQDVVGSCFVEVVAPAGPGAERISLSCPDLFATGDPASIGVDIILTSDPAVEVSLTLGSLVELGYGRDGMDGWGTRVRLRSEQSEILLAAASVPDLAGFDAPPLSVAAVPGLCPPMGENDCERVAISVADHIAQAEFFAGTRGSFMGGSTYVVQVGTARQCATYPDLDGPRFDVIVALEK